MRQNVPRRAAGKEEKTGRTALRGVVTARDVVFQEEALRTSVTRCAREAGWDRLWTNFATLEQLEAIRHLLGAELIYDDGATLRPTGRTLATFRINGECNTLRGPRVELKRDRRAADIT